MRKKITKKIIIALDVEKDRALKIVEDLGKTAEFYKIGLSLFLEYGKELVLTLRDLRKKIFLDLKFHDIPHQVRIAALRAANLGVSLFTVHAAGGPRMIEAAKEAVEGTDTKVIAVTLLTSIEEKEKELLGFEPNISVQLAKIAFDAGADGIVLSGDELPLLRDKYTSKIFIVPGIRDLETSVHADDQKRITTPEKAFELGADYVVIGRPITSSNSPKSALKGIIEHIEKHQK